MTLASIIETGIVRPVWLARITAAKYLPFFEADGGAYKVAEVDRVVDVKVNGDGLTLAANAGAVQSTEGTWFWDRTYLWVHLVADADPLDTDQNVIAFLRFDLSSKTVDLDGVEWQGRLKQLPGLSLRIEDEFDGISQISGGNLVALNQDGFFDTRFGLQWDAGRTQIYFGDASQVFADFLLLATLENMAAINQDDSFQLRLEEIKGRGKKKVPYTFYTLDEFPLMREQDIGRVKQIAFGFIRGINPVCINTIEAEFRVCDHPMRSFDGVKVRNPDTGVWESVDFLAVDEANGIFRLDPADWQDGLDVSVDFQGWVDDNAHLQTNSSDVMRAIIEKFGETSLDEDSFDDAHDVLDIGYLFIDATRRVTRRNVSLYLDQQFELLDIARRINVVVGSYLTTDEQGRFRYQVFRPQQGKDLEVITDSEILDGSFQVYNESGTDISSVAALFGSRPQEDIKEITTVSRPINQYVRDRPEALAKTISLDTTDRADARRICQRILTLAQSRKIRYKLKLKWLGFTMRVGDQIRLEYDRHGLDQVLEILEWKPSIGQKSMVELTLGNLHGYDDICGFWVESTDTTPDGDPLTWDGTERKYKRQNSGHWHNGQWFAMDTPTSRDDYRTSVWVG